MKLNKSSLDQVLAMLATIVSASGSLTKSKDGSVSADLTLTCDDGETHVVTLDQYDRAYKGMVKCWPGISPVKLEMIESQRAALKAEKDAKKEAKEKEKAEARQKLADSREAKRKEKEAAKLKREEDAKAKVEAKKKADMEKAKVAADKKAKADAEKATPTPPAPTKSVMDKNNAKAEKAAKAAKK